MEDNVPEQKSKLTRQQRRKRIRETTKILLKLLPRQTKLVRWLRNVPEMERQLFRKGLFKDPGHRKKYRELIDIDREVVYLLKHRNELEGTDKLPKEIKNAERLLIDDTST